MVLSISFPSECLESPGIRWPIADQYDEVLAILGVSLARNCVSSKISNTSWYTKYLFDKD